MRIAIVGGGNACCKLMELFENRTFREINPKLVAVSDLRDDAPGMIRAREKGIETVHDYNHFFARRDIDLIVELTGNQEIYNDILGKKDITVRAINHRTALLFWEMSLEGTCGGDSRGTHLEARETYKMLVNELIQEDVMVISANHQILDINETMLRKLNMRRMDVIGRFCYEITYKRETPCDGEKHPCPLVHVIRDQKPFQTTYTRPVGLNEERYYSISCYPLFEGGEVVGGVEISRDITRDIKMQKVLMQQQKLASIGRLAAGVAHEINNPMTTILTCAMLLQEETDTEDPKYTELQTIADETLRCRKIVTSLLDFARQTKTDKKQCNVNEIVKSCVVLTQKKAAFKDVAMEGYVTPEIPIVQADKDQIQQALINLTINAVEATEPGGTVTLKTGYDESGRIVRISVTDTGKGISEADMEKIFDPFFTTKESGTGLGLAITHGIIEQHNGTIGVRKNPEGGTIFEIDLPIEEV